MSINIGNSSFGAPRFDKSKNDVRKNNLANILKFDDVKKAAETDNQAPVNNISRNNEEKLSQKAQDYLSELREKYGDFDFMVGNSTDDLQALSKTGNKEFSVIFSSAELERMANDEKYAASKMNDVFGAIDMAKRIEDEFGDRNPEGTDSIERIGVIVDENGNMKYFAELEKNSARQKERIEKSREEQANDKKEFDKEFWKTPYDPVENPVIKRTMVEAETLEELLEKIQNVDWENVAESKAGDRIDFTI